MTQFYIGSKQVTAWHAEKDGQSGYGITYEDGYQSWSPKAVFERAYLAMGESNDGTRVTEDMVNGFILNATASKVGLKTTVVVLSLANGFEVVGHSSCVDPANYDHDLGTKLAMQRAKDHVWMLLGFLLQTARGGVIFANTGCKTEAQV